MKIYDYILCSGSGNRFLLFDTLRSDLSGLNIAAFAAGELHRFGVDGLLLLTRDGRGRFGMRMFNTDGSEAEMCGNGIRCVARLARERYPEATGERFAVTSGGREYRITCEEPIFGALPTFGAEIPLSLHGDDFPPSLPPKNSSASPFPNWTKGRPSPSCSRATPTFVAPRRTGQRMAFRQRRAARYPTARGAGRTGQPDARGIPPGNQTSSLFCRLDEGRIFAATYERGVGIHLLLRHGDVPRAPRPPHCSDSPASTRLSRSGTAAAACAACRAARSRESSPARRATPLSKRRDGSGSTGKSASPRATLRPLEPALRPAAADRRDPARTTTKNTVLTIADDHD